MSHVQAPDERMRTSLDYPVGANVDSEQVRPRGIGAGEIPCASRRDGRPAPARAAPAAGSLRTQHVHAAAPTGTGGRHGATSQTCTARHTRLPQHQDGGRGKRTKVTDGRGLGRWDEPMLRGPLGMLGSRSLWNHR